MQTKTIFKHKEISQNYRDFRSIEQSVMSLIVLLNNVSEDKAKYLGKVYLMDSSIFSNSLLTLELTISENY